MQVLPIDLTALVAIIMGISVVLIPVAGVTLRFALQPLADAFKASLSQRGTEDTIAIVERRMLLLEEQVEGMRGSVDRLLEVAEFDAALKSGEASPGLPPSSGGTASGP